MTNNIFIFNYENLLGLLEEKQKTLNFSISDIKQFSIEKGVKFTLRFRSFQLENLKRYNDIINTSNNKFSLKEIFSFNDNIIDVIVKLFDIYCEDNKKSKCIAISFYLQNIIIKEDLKYFKSICFMTNMKYTPTFEESINLFNFDNTSFYERLLNLFPNNNNNFFVSPIGTKCNFKKQDIDLNLYLLKNIVKVLKDIFQNNISFTEAKEFYNLLDNLSNDDKYEKIMNVINIILSSNDRIKNIYQITPGKFNYGNIVDIYDFDSINTNTIFTSIISMTKFDFDILKKFYELFGVLIFTNNILNLMDTINSLNCFICKELIDSIFNIIKIKNLKIDRQYSEQLKSFNFSLNELSKLKFKIMKNITLSNFFEILFEASRYVIVDTKFIYFLTSYPYDDIIEILFAIFLINDCNKTLGEVIIDVIGFFSIIRNPNPSLTVYKNKKYYEGPHIGNYFCDNSDNYLFNRIARLILFKDLIYSGRNHYKLLGYNCSDSIFNHITYNMIKRTELIEYYGQSIDVHDKNRDNDTYKIYNALFSLSLNDENTEDPWKSLDNISNTNKNIEILFNEFWDFCKEFVKEDQKEKFFRVMGIDFDFNKIPEIISDFPGFFNGNIFIYNLKTEPKTILAYLWKFAKMYPSEKLEEALVLSILNSVQEKIFLFDGKKVKKDYVVCNQGKIQNMAVAILQGRIKDNFDNLILIDKQKITKVISEENLNKITPADIYLIIKPFYDFISQDGFIPENADELFRKLFNYIKENNLEKYTGKIIETVCLYSETKDGFNINIDLSLASCFSNCFQLDDYILIKEHIKNLIENEDEDRIFNDNDDNYYEGEDEYENEFYEMNVYYN